MRFHRVEDWLNWQQSLNPHGIELGLERVRRVAERLGVLTPAPVVISVGGTNGKGSVVAFLEGALRAAGYRVGSYTSPHILRYHERIRVDGQPIDDSDLCHAFARVDAERRDEALTYFEFGTLAALSHFRDSSLDAAVLEVGLGGRLDAVNIVDANAAVVISVGLDHTDWLGSDLDAIGREKAGIFRRDRPAVIGQRNPPRGLLEGARTIGAQLIRLGADYDFAHGTAGWTWRGVDDHELTLPPPRMAGAHQLQNAAAAVAALRALQPLISVPPEAIGKSIAEAALPGRFQILPGPVPLILDVAHNAEAASALARVLASTPVTGQTLAVCGMLKDKPVADVARIMDAVVDRWFCGGLAVPRGLGGAELARRVAPVRGPVTACDDIAGACAAARAVAHEGDRLVVFGSFHTVEAVSRLNDG